MKLFFDSANWIIQTAVLVKMRADNTTLQDPIVLFTRKTLTLLYKISNKGNWIILYCYLGIGISLIFVNIYWLSNKDFQSSKFTHDYQLITYHASHTLYGYMSDENKCFIVKTHWITLHLAAVKQKCHLSMVTFL